MNRRKKRSKNISDNDDLEYIERNLILLSKELKKELSIENVQNYNNIKNKISILNKRKDELLKNNINNLGTTTNTNAFNIENIL